MNGFLFVMVRFIMELMLKIVIYNFVLFWT